MTVWGTLDMTAGNGILLCGSTQEGAYQLQVAPGHALALQEAVDQVDSEEEGLRHELRAHAGPTSGGCLWDLHAVW